MEDVGVEDVGGEDLLGRVKRCRRVGDVGGDLQPLLVTELGDLLLDLGVDLLDCLLETLVLLLVS